MQFILSLMLLVFTQLALGEPANKIEIQKVTENVYALVGQRGPMSKWNFGTNATFGVIVTNAGVVLIDPGASDKAAEYIQKKIREITDQPVVLVINTGSEDLRWLGNARFKAAGAKIITSEVALVDQRQRASDQLSRLDEYIFPELSAGTTPVFADSTFNRETTLKVGDVKLVLKYTGPAYLPGDFFVWLPEQKTVFAGDIISTERMLAVARDSRTASWIASFREIEKLKPEHVVPGHGHATDIKKARADTLAFLTDMREAVKTFMHKGGRIENVSSLKEYPLSPYERLIGYEMLLGRNVLHIYMEMEWE